MYPGLQNRRACFLPLTLQTMHVVSWSTHSVLADVMVIAASTNNSWKKYAFYRHLSTQHFQWLFQFIVGETPKAGLSHTFRGDGAAGDGGGEAGFACVQGTHTWVHSGECKSPWPVIHIAHPRAYGAVLRSPPVSRWRGCPGIRRYIASCRITQSDHTWGEGLMESCEGTWKVIVKKIQFS